MEDFLTNPDTADQSNTDNQSNTPAPPDQPIKPSLLALKQSLRNGTIPKAFSVGKTISDTWTDPDTHKTHKMPFIIVDYRKVKLHDFQECLAAILLRKHVPPLRLRYGERYLSRSDLIAWANSRQYIEQIDRQGYLAGCSPELLQVVSPILIRSDANVGGETIPLCFFPPSLDELSIDIDDNDTDEPPWEYFQRRFRYQPSTAKRWLFTDPFGHERDCWLRSTRRGGPNHIWATSTSGEATLCNATSLNHCLLACAVTAD